MTPVTQFKNTAKDYTAKVPMGRSLGTRLSISMH